MSCLWVPLCLGQLLWGYMPPELVVQNAQLANQIVRLRPGMAQEQVYRIMALNKNTSVLVSGRPSRHFWEYQKDGVRVRLFFEYNEKKGQHEFVRRINAAGQVPSCTKMMSCLDIRKPVKHASADACVRHVGYG